MSLIQRNVVALADGMARCEVVPEAGGAIAAFWWELGRERIDWLRAASPAAVAAGGADGMACFPLLPWGNRIREGRFLFCGREVQPGTSDPHGLHGHGWRRGWSVVERSAAHLTMEYRHEPDGWPWAYVARQRVAVEDGSLALTLEITNLSDGLMPAGLGFHPYFPMAPGLALEAALKGVWLSDEHKLPREHVALPPEWDFTAGRPVAALTLDHVFSGWNGRAVLRWPGRRCRLALEAGWPILSFLAVFVPDARDYLCVEPMSHCADAINIAREGGADTGLRVLAPGACRSASLRIKPACD